MDSFLPILPLRVSHIATKRAAKSRQFIILFISLLTVPAHAAIASQSLTGRPMNSRMQFQQDVRSHAWRLLAADSGTVETPVVDSLQQAQPPGTSAAPAPLPVTAQPQESTEGTVWMSSQFLLSWPTGEFQPPSSERGLGFGFVLTYVRPRGSLHPRFEFGTATHESSVDSILVNNPNGIWVDDLNVDTGSSLMWAMIGVQWNPLPVSSLLYLYAMGGLGRISPTEKLGDGYPLIEADVPGLPPSEDGFAWSAGIGTRLRVPGTKRWAITGEFDYRRLGAVDYVGPPGVEGDYPNSHFVVVHGPVETWTGRLGLAIAFDQH